ncbi:hypothetical protein ACFP47_09590 [Nesterenkonia lacusekhoensis]|uniref:THIF-type NAD/FAD binding fold domain-containing protein n=1 Tax=Nesterenkonia lacusekhoensis TaxID=150832 RepID=A0ABS4T3J1_9MICC|nr:hypothetical protein [Nesterenkonia lacusekhoensis]MBP2318680.1 hypothetical protein [Nesterenkonia lacusekhoensis]
MDLHPRRRLAAVLVDGLGPVGARTALALAEAGVGTLLLRDGAPVTAQQVGDPYLSIHHGLPRSTAVKDLLDRAAHSARAEGSPPAVVECPGDMRPVGTDVCVLDLGLQKDLSIQEDLGLAAQHASLVMPVTGGPSVGEAMIGPLMAHPAASQPAAPEGFACAGCWELSAGPDPRDQSASDQTSVDQTTGSRGQSGEDRLLHQIAAGLIARQLLILVEAQHRPALAEHSLVLTADGGADRRPAPVHPECPCQLVSPEPLPS